MTYPPLAHLPKSMVRQRSLQNGNSGSLFSTILRQMGQRRLRTDFFAMMMIQLSVASCRLPKN
jgi:hypothetical protein